MFYGWLSLVKGNMNVADYGKKNKNSQKHFNPANKLLIYTTVILKWLMICKLLNYKIASFSSSEV